MAIRRCPRCAHRAPLLAGRCTEPAGEAICGCSCAPGRRPALDARRSSTGADTGRVLQAVADGHTWGVGVSAVTGLQVVRVYATLRQLVAMGLLEKEAGRGPKRDRYRVTDAGRGALDRSGLPGPPVRAEHPGGHVAVPRPGH